MPASPNKVPPGHHSVTPYLIVNGAAKAIEFYTKAFGAAKLMEPIMHADGRVGHVELKVGDSVIMLADEFPEMDVRGPESHGGSPVTLHLYVENVDDAARQFVTAGGSVKRPVADQFYGDRTGTFVDPFGHTWHIATSRMSALRNCAAGPNRQ